MVQLLEKRNGKPRSSLYEALRDMGLCKARCRIAASFNGARESLILIFREKWAVSRTQSTLAPALTTIQFEAGPKPTGNWRKTLSTLCKNRIPVNAQPRSCVHLEALVAGSAR